MGGGGREQAVGRGLLPAALRALVARALPPRRPLRALPGNTCSGLDRWHDNIIGGSAGRSGLAYVVLSDVHIQATFDFFLFFLLENFRINLFRKRHVHASVVLYYYEITRRIEQLYAMLVLTTNKCLLYLYCDGCAEVHRAGALGHYSWIGVRRAGVPRPALPRREGTT